MVRPGVSATAISSRPFAEVVTVTICNQMWQMANPRILSNAPCSLYVCRAHEITFMDNGGKYNSYYVNS
jgi:hypothetical protein